MLAPTPRLPRPSSRGIDMAYRRKAWRGLAALSLGLIGSLGHARTFGENDLAGAWVLTAQGTILGTAMPLSLLGVIEFERGGHCQLDGTVNAGGLSWLSSAASCGFQLKSNGTGSLVIKLPPGPVVMSSVPLSFIVVDEHEIRAMAIDNVNLSALLRRQDR